MTQSIILAIACTVFVLSCDTFDSKLKVRNNKGYPVVCTILKSTSQSSALEYFATTTIPNGARSSFTIIQPNGIKTNSTIDTWERVFEEMPHSEMLVVYAIPAKYIGTDTTEMKKSLMKYPIHYDSLKRNNWIVEIK